MIVPEGAAADDARQGVAPCTSDSRGQSRVLLRCGAVVFTSPASRRRLARSAPRPRAAASWVARLPRSSSILSTGTRSTSAQLYGKQAVYLKFWATWCGPCRAQMPHFKHVYETAGADLAVIGVNSASTILCPTSARRSTSSASRCLR